LRKKRVNKVDKHEYKLRADEIKALIQEKRYKEAVEIADTIDWKGIKRAMTLCTISDLYKINKRYKDALEILLLAYDINPGSRMILYSLCELSLKVNDIVNAIEYCKEFQQVAPQDSGRYILQYKIYTTIGNSLEDRISVLEEFQRVDCKDKWMYELAHLYHLAGEGIKCVEECNQVIIYFGEGKYVIKALELMRLHTPLSPEYELLYNTLTTPVEDIKIGALDLGQYNPDDLQRELASNLQEVLTSESVSEISIPVSETAYSEFYESEITYSEISFSESESEAPVYYESEASAPEPEDRIYEAPVQEPAAIEEAAQDDSLYNTTMYKPITIDIPLEDEATKIMDVRAVNRALEHTSDALAEPVYEETDKEEPVYEVPKKEAVRITPPSDTGFKGQVIEPHKSWDMHEIDLGISDNSAIKYPNYDDMVSVEGDGQLSIVMPEQERVDKQITGQISIDDILLEWERMKTESDRKWQEGIKQSVISKTNDMFANFEREAQNGLLEELEISTRDGEKVTLSVEEQKEMLFGNSDEGRTESESESLYEEIILIEDDMGGVLVVDGTGSSESLETVSFESESETETESESVSEITSDGQENSEAPVSNGDISEIFYSEEADYINGEGAVSSDENTVAESVNSESITEDYNDVYTGQDEPGPTLEGLSFDRTPFLSDKKEEESNEVSDDTSPMPNLEDLDYLMKFASNIEEKEIADKAIFGVAQMMADGNDKPGDIFKNETEAEDVILNVSEAETSEEPVEQPSESESEDILLALFGEQETSETSEVPESESVILEFAEVSEAESSDTAPTESESENKSETEETAESESAEIADEISASSDETYSEEASSSESESDEIIEAESEQGQEVSDNNDSAHEASSDEGEQALETESEPGLTEEQKERFDDFIYVEGMEEQIVNALNKISMEASHGNIIIGSEDVDGAVDLGKEIVQDMFESGIFTGKFGKTKGSSLNNKDLNETFEKFADGAIIIQDVGDLKPETINALEKKLSDPELNVIVILTANYRAKHKFIMNNTEFMKHFDISIDLISMETRELADYAVEYARLCECSIDEVALLALHTKIEEKQTNTHAVRISEVREIIDNAKAEAKRFSLSLIGDVLFGRRHDDEELFVLKEKDFD